MQAVVGNIATLKRGRDAYDVAYRELSEQLKRGEVDTFKFVDVTRTDANGTTTVERFGDVCPKPPKKRDKTAGDAAPPSSRAPYQTFQSAPFDARAVFSAALGGEAAYPELLEKLGAKAPKTNYFQSVMCFYFTHRLNKLERDKLVAGTAAETLLPGFNTFAKFVAEAKALLADGDGGAEEAGDGEGEEE